MYVRIYTPTLNQYRYVLVQRTMYHLNRRYNFMNILLSMYFSIVLSKIGFEFFLNLICYITYTYAKKRTLFFHTNLPLVFIFFICVN